jgi:hypothetical protein
MIRVTRSRIHYTIETNMRGDPPEAETRSFVTFAEAKSSMASEFDRQMGCPRRPRLLDT